MGCRAGSDLGIDPSPSQGVQGGLHASPPSLVREWPGLGYGMESADMHVGRNRPHNYEYGSSSGANL
jgi:hypothetical protein